jgi:mannose-6-phosphate isomerase
VSDRPGDVSVIANGPLAGQTLRWLMENHARELLGPAHDGATAFPLLVKILDAQDKLSLQVHPPASKAATLGGEPKTEMWYIVDAAPGAELFVGLRRGVTREEFERKIAAGEVADCFHRHAVKAGDTMFLPSGRVHAIGAGNVIFEVQQNSDTTYRVFDWNRVGLDGKPRELHVAQSLESIDFNDFEPPLVQPEEVGSGAVKFRYLVDDPLFRISVTHIRRGERCYLRTHGPQILGVINGRLAVQGGGVGVELSPGQFVLLPACLERIAFQAATRVEYLQVQF